MLLQLQNAGVGLIELPPVAYTTPDRRNAEDEIPFDLEDCLKGDEIVVLDGYWFGEKYQQRLRKYPVKIAIIEDDGKGNYCADMIINHAPGLKAEDYTLDTKNPVFALGPDYALLRPEFLKAAREERRAKVEIKTVMVCFGGADSKNLVNIVTGWLLQNTDYHVHAIVGGSFRNIIELNQRRINASSRLTISQNLREAEMLAAMKDADLAIVPASGILYECIACRLPVISGYCAENQKRIYQGLLHFDAFEDAGEFDEMAIQRAIKQLSLDRLKEISEHQKVCIDGKSMDRMKNAFLSMRTVA